MAEGQTVAISGSGASPGFLAAANNSAQSGTGTIYYSDGTTQSFTLDVGNFWYPSGEDGNPDDVQVAGDLDDHAQLGERELLVHRVINLGQHAARGADLDQARVAAQLLPDRPGALIRPVGEPQLPAQPGELVKQRQRVRVQVAVAAGGGQDRAGQVDRRPVEHPFSDRAGQVHTEPAHLTGHSSAMVPRP
jgi:hypothetical protein